MAGSGTEGIAAWQLSDNFGVNSKPEPDARLYSQLRSITFPYFDEVWVITPQGQGLVVLRLSTGSDPTHTTVPYTEQS